jgi:hypothetical protein
MPRILPTFAAIAIVGVCIAFNTMRYPIVWKMVGPNSQASLSDKNAPVAEVASSAKVESSASSAPNPSPTPEAKPADKIADEIKTSATISADPPRENPVEKADVPKAIPISLPKDELATGDPLQGVDKSEKVENSNPTASSENLINSPGRLVPVAKDAISAGVLVTRMDEVRRLPPLETQVAYPANRNADEFSQSAIPIYPSTGK